MNIPNCNSCRAAMRLEHHGHGAMAPIEETVFACSECDQKVGVSPDGRSWQLILPRLYPDKRPPRMEHEYDGSERSSHDARRSR